MSIKAAAAALGGQKQLALAMGVSPSAVNQFLSGLRELPRDRCPAIEHATNGVVVCEDLRPDVRWQRVPDPAWPHPAGRPCIDVTDLVPQAAP
jgi:DNA-binding transcriptional regulator YdaS (Cro superfamily)